MAPKKTSRNPASSARAIKQRLQYLCALLYGGKHSRFAEAVGCKDISNFKRVVYGNQAVTSAFLGNIVRHGVVNAEFLLCGTGPVRAQRPENATGQLELAECFNSSRNCFDTQRVQFSLADPVELPSIGAVEPELVRALMPAARSIYAARAADKPVIVYLTEQFVLAGASAIVAEMLRKKYVTAVVATLGAVYRDAEWARFGGCAQGSSFLHELTDLNDAAYLAAAHGFGYGEAVGRWCYLQNACREHSAAAVAYALGAPLFVHVTIGDSPTHWFPSTRVAELGAAVGAAAYTDLLLFTEYVRQCIGTPGGALIATSASGPALFSAARAAIHSDKSEELIDDVDTHLLDTPIISGELWRTFPALLIACDAVYDGSADDGR